MGSVEIILQCVGHCVETAARREFERLMGNYFDEKGNSENLETRIELLSNFLNTANFPALRASDPRFSGETPGPVALIKDENAEKGYRLKIL